MGWFHTHKWLKIRRGMLSAEAPPPQRVRGPSSTPGHQPRVPVPGRQVPITSGCKNQWELKLRETKFVWSPRQFLLKDLYTYLLELTPSELQHGGSNSKGTKDIKARNELSGIREKMGVGAAFCQTKVLAETIVSFLIPPPEAAGRPYLSLHQPG